MWIASPIAVFRFDCSRSYQTKWAAFWSATIEEEKRSVTRDCARSRGGIAATATAAPARRRRWRRLAKGAGAIDSSPLCIGLVNRSTVSMRATPSAGVYPRRLAREAARRGPAVEPLKRVVVALGSAAAPEV